MCRSVIFQEDEETVTVEERAQEDEETVTVEERAQEEEETVTVEETAQQTLTVSYVFSLIDQKLCGAAKSFYKRCFLRARRAGSSEREIEMANVSTPGTPQ